MVTHLPSTSEVSGSNPGPYVVKLFAHGGQFKVQNLDQLYELVFSAHKTTCHDINLYSVESNVNPK